MRSRRERRRQSRGSRRSAARAIAVPALSEDDPHRRGQGGQRRDGRVAGSARVTPWVGVGVASTALRTSTHRSDGRPYDLPSDNGLASRAIKHALLLGAKWTHGRLARERGHATVSAPAAGARARVAGWYRRRCRGWCPHADWNCPARTLVATAAAGSCSRSSCREAPTATTPSARSASSARQQAVPARHQPDVVLPRAFRARAAEFPVAEDVAPGASRCRSSPS
jgi:hypothetical protein